MNNPESPYDLLVFCKGLFASPVAGGLDIQNVSVKEVSENFVQDNEGVRISFTVSRHFLFDKMMDKVDALDALERLIKNEGSDA